MFITLVANVFYKVVIIHLCIFRKIFKITYKISYIQALQKITSRRENYIKRQTRSE